MSHIPDRPAVATEYLRLSEFPRSVSGAQRVLRQGLALRARSLRSPGLVCDWAKMPAFIQLWDIMPSSTGLPPPHSAKANGVSATGGSDPRFTSRLSLDAATEYLRLSEFPRSVSGAQRVLRQGLALRARSLRSPGLVCDWAKMPAFIQLWDIMPSSTGLPPPHSAKANGVSATGGSDPRFTSRLSLDAATEYLRLSEFPRSVSGARRVLRQGLACLGDIIS